VPIKVIRMRFGADAPPMPEGCRWCGMSYGGHVQLWVPSVKYHSYAPPTRVQLIARKRAWNRIKGFS
jgi:hypothetical protein